MGWPMLGRRGQVAGGPSNGKLVVMQAHSVGPNWLYKVQPGRTLKNASMCGVILSCSPAVIISCKLAGKHWVLTAASANACNATNGKNNRLTARSSSRASSLVKSRRCSSVTSTRVPPVLRVAKTDWQETPQITGGNWSVRVPASDCDCRDCQRTRFAKGWCPTHTPLGSPVVPEV